MILTRFYDEKLAQASYLLGCARSGHAIVIDPNRRVGQYIDAAEQAGLKLIAVTETHIHADFVSGSRELAERSGARLYLSGAGDANWQYAYAEESGAELLREGSVIRIGEIRIDVLHTPGHTPEHLSFVVTDGAVATSPMGVVTGDFVFVGDVGRPDLLERAVHVAGSAATSARTLFESLQRFKTLPDHLQIWPGHGAGSACGKGLSAVPQSTIGYERLFNQAFRFTDEAAFIHEVLSGQPEPPKYFAEMKRINKMGPPVLGGIRRPVRLPEARLPRLLKDGAFVVDTRTAADFAAGHVPGTISLPLNKSFTSWAGWLLPYDRDFYLIIDERVAPGVEGVVRDLAMIGLDRIGGFFGAEAVETWGTSEGPLEVTRQLTLAELDERRRAGALVLDVRNGNEWDAGHIPGAKHIPLGYLPESLAQIPRDVSIVVHCQGGGRSAIAASILQAHGHKNVQNLGPGFGGYQSAGMPVEGES
ncbi:MAG: MBL fold metallo-hydrolase [Gemmatimonadota bacterium]